MANPAESNGDTDVTIEAFEMTEGWVFLRASSIEHHLEQIPFVLSQAMSDWLLDNPHFKVRSTLPVVASGFTVGIHLWYDEVPV